MIVQKKNEISYREGVNMLNKFMVSLSLLKPMFIYLMYQSLYSSQSNLYYRTKVLLL